MTLLPILTAGTLAVADLPKAFLDRVSERGVAQTPRILVVRVSEQTMTFFENGKTRATWSVSTAAKGLGERVDTYQTPRGLHRIKEKIGAGAPKGAIFDSREFKGEIWVPPPVLASVATRVMEALHVAPDLVITRILWLEGLEPGKNAGSDAEGVLVDSYQRFIYIHGTNSEALLGKPVSRGCIRMRSEEILALFDLVEPGDMVWIEE